MKFKKFKTALISLFAVAMLTAPTDVYAADAAVIFGSDSYENESGAEFPIGVYIDGDSDIGFYHVEISYDPERLEYIEGATSGGDGTIIFEGNGNADQVSTMLRFRALSGGETELSISDARVRVAGTDSEVFDMTELARVPVTITGESVTPSEEQTETSADEATQSTEETAETETQGRSDENRPQSDSSSFNATIIPVIAVLGGILAAILIVLGARSSKRRKKAERIEKARAVGEKLRSKEQAPKEAVRIPKEGVGAQSKEKSVDVKSAEKKIPESKGIKEKDQQKKSTYIKAAPEAKTTERADTAVVPETKRPVKKQDSVQEKAQGKEQGKAQDKGQYNKQSDGKEKAQDREQDRLQNKAQNKDQIIKRDTEQDKDPVIDVRNVSMEFKVSNSNASGLKDYAIQKMRGKLKYRRLKALDDISFKVFKGEVVGIIGSNGSGKSTLLKIVSGALRPTGGEVIADKSKIQLLTFGAGFDGELSAKENVYLNGAIIGYDKEFIDKHYDEIVEFSELQDFMDEKVKNFSSGMVSRLAFSIATVAGAAEILILDEVLAVGDQFFRKKSLERVQQMIHGGSTVLIVSHSLNTIKTHCTKVVWIEKGVMKMVGEPKAVCEEYAKSHGREADGAVEKSGEENKEKILYMKNGKPDESFTGVAADAKGILRYYNKGIFDREYNGLLAFMPETKDWLYIKNGIVDESYSGIAKTRSGNWYFVKEGHIDRTYTGLALSPGKNWYYMKHGKLDRSYSGITQGPSGGWYYVKDGKFDPTYTGPAKAESGNWYYVKEGRYDNKFSGKIEYKGKTVEVKNGRIQATIEK